MNILEHYIIEVYRVKTIPHQEWMTCEWVEAEMMVNCYGAKNKTTYIGTRDEFERDIKRGYYMG